MTQKKVNPAAGDTASGARVASRGSERWNHNSGLAPDKAKLTFTLPSSDESVTVDGREAQTLALLVNTGARGVTSGEASGLGWARRTNAYVHKLSRLGVPIAPRREKTPDGAVVARYTLVVPVWVVKALNIGSTSEGTAKTE